jgi:hypothetical protein
MHIWDEIPKWNKRNRSSYKRRQIWLTVKETFLQLMTINFSSRIICVAHWTNLLFFTFLNCSMGIAILIEFFVIRCNITQVEVYDRILAYYMIQYYDRISPWPYTEKYGRLRPCVFDLGHYLTKWWLDERSKIDLLYCCSCFFPFTIIFLFLFHFLDPAHIGLCVYDKEKNVSIAIADFTVYFVYFDIFISYFFFCLSTSI